MPKHPSSREKSPRPDADARPDPPSPTRDLVDRETVLVLLLVVVVVGAWLRFRGLETQSLWNDELWTWQIADKESLHDVLTTGKLPLDVHPPLHFMMHYYLQKYVGESETVLRMPSAIAGVLTIVAVYLLGRRLYSDTEGLIAAALTAVFIFPIRYSQEARAYSMLFLFSTLTVYFLLPVLRDLCAGKRPPLWPTVGYMTCALVTSYLHYFGLFLILVQALAMGGVLLLKRARALGWLALLYLPVAAGYVPWMPMVMRAARIKSFWITRPSTNPFAAFTFHLQYVVNHSYVFAWTAMGLWAWVLGRAVYEKRTGKSDPAGKPRTPYAGLVLMLWIVVPFAVPYVKSLISTPVIVVRNLIVILPAIYLLTARGIARIPLPRTYVGLLTAAVCIALVCHGVYGLHYYNLPHKDQFRDVVRYVLGHDRAAEDIPIVAVSYGDRFFDYYFRRLGSPKRVEVAGGTARDIPKVRDFLTRRKPQYLWFVWGHKTPEQEFLDYLMTDYTPIDAKRFPVRAGVVLLSRNPAASTR